MIIVVNEIKDTATLKTLFYFVNKKVKYIRRLLHDKAFKDEFNCKFLLTMIVCSPKKLFIKDILITNYKFKLQKH